MIKEWVDSWSILLKCGNDLIIKGKKVFQIYPRDTRNMSVFYSKAALTVTCGIDGVVGLCSTLPQRECSLTGPHGHFLVVTSITSQFDRGVHKAAVS